MKLIQFTPAQLVGILGFGMPTMTSKEQLSGRNGSSIVSFIVLTYTDRSTKKCAMSRRLSILPNNFQLVNYDVTNSAYILASVKLQDHSSLQNRTSNIFEQAENLELDFLDKGNIF